MALILQKRSMNQQLLNKIPTWYKDINPKEYYLVMTNDFDSYYSCQVVKKHTGLEIGGYYCFNKGLYLNKEITQGKEPVYVDLSIVEGKTFDNHFTCLHNAQAINPNVMTNTYYKKYNGSTLALVCSLYGKDISLLQEKSLATLLCIDGWHKGYYNKGGRYKDINIYWYQMLEMDKYLLPLLQDHDNQYFEDHIKTYKLNTPIKIENGFLKCDVTLKSLPTYKFNLVQAVKKECVTKNRVQSIYQDNPNSIFTGAETYKDSYVISRKVEAA